MEEQVDLSPMDFSDLAPVEVPVTVADKKYILREASGDAACRWNNAVSKAYKLSPDGKAVAIDGLPDVEPLLVSMCLYTPDANGKVVVKANGDADPKTLVPLATIRSWPSRVQKALFDRAKKISALGETDDAEVVEKQIEVLQRRLAKLRGEPSPN